MEVTPTSMEVIISSHGSGTETSSSVGDRRLHRRLQTSKKRDFNIRFRVGRSIETNLYTCYRMLHLKLPNTRQPSPPAGKTQKSILAVPPPRTPARPYKHALPTPPPLLLSCHHNHDFLPVPLRSAFSISACASCFAPGVAIRLAATNLLFIYGGIAGWGPHTPARRAMIRPRRPR